MLKTTQVLQGRYQLHKQLGNNAGRQTWLAADINTSPAEPVTVKLLAFSPQMQWDEFKLFEREASVLKQLNHPRIPKYRDYFSLDKQTGAGLCWFGLVQDYIPENSLQQLLDQGKRFTEAQVRSLAIQILEILTYLHGLNPPVLHRDIKPSNLILGEDKRVYLVDFGAVQDSAAVEGVTFTVVGTTGYAPLEQFWGKAVEASDLYALGATLIHVLTGLAPTDLPQRNLRIQFKEQISINPAFLSWIEALTEPDLNLRLTSCTQALEALQIGRFITYSLQPVHPPCRTRIQLQKSPTQLSIKIPGRGIFVLEDFIVWIVNLFPLLCTGLVLVLVLCFISMMGMLFLVAMFTSMGFPLPSKQDAINIAIFIHLIVTFLIWLIWKEGSKKGDKKLIRSSRSHIPISTYFIEFDRNEFVIERRAINFCYFRQRGQASNIVEIFSSNDHYLTMQAEHILQKRYRLNEQLGQNASRQTWLATDIQSSPPSPVIVKLLAFNPQMQWDDLKLFEREAQVLKNLNHPKIPQYRDYFSVDDVEGSGLRWFGLVQEYIPGKSIKHKRFTEAGVRSIATQVLQILIALHELSPPVLHRDIKPSNLIMAKDNQIYLVDFGAVQDKAKAEGATFTVVGTSGYAPPEQLWGKAVPASDLYALGATLIHLLTGSSPAELPQNQMRIQFRDQVTINPEFANWIEQLIQPAPERRFSTARQALEALQAKNSTNFNNENVTEKDAPNYAAGFLLTFLIGSGFFLLPSFFYSLTGSVNHAKQAEPKQNIGAINRAQQAYYLENDQFTTDFTKLGLGIKTETINYRYSIRGTKKAVISYAIAKKPTLKSYVGINGTTVVNTVGNTTPELLSLGIICESNTPTTLLPEPNKDKSGAIKLECPQGYKGLGGH